MRARTDGSAWEVLAPAKLNLYLEILGRRDDGFHELDTLMTPVRIYDRLRWSPTCTDRDAPFSLQYDRTSPLELQRAAPADATNLVWRAFQLIGQTAGLAPFGRATIEKRIPIQAGMGGASSDAAAALILANSAWRLGYPYTRLSQLAAQLGSDVPFFLAGGPAVCRGRGERVEPVRGLPPLHFVIAKPPVGVSTTEAFGSLQSGPTSASAAQDSQTRLQKLVDSLTRGALGDAAQLMANRLEGVAMALCPWISRLRDAFGRSGCLGRLMTGSGSAYVGLVRSARQARRVAGQLSSLLSESNARDATNGRVVSGVMVFTASS